MTEFYPRVLVVSTDAFGDHSATAITLTNLFKGWPTESLALIYLNMPKPDPEVCQYFWNLSLDDIPIDRFIRKVLGSRKDKIIGKAAAGLPAGMEVYVTRKKNSTRTLLYVTAHSWASLLPFHPDPSFWNFVKEFRPDIIYSVLGNNRIMDIVLRLSKHCNAPIVPHFMDDWPSTSYHGLLNLIPRGIMQYRIKAIMKRSILGMAISDYMVVEFQKRYMIHFRAFMNCTNVPNERSAEEEKKNFGVRFVYVGGLHLNRWKSLSDFENAFSILRMEGLKSDLIIHSPSSDITEYSKHFSAFQNVTIGNTLTQQEVPETMLRADVLVHMESFDHAVQKYTRLSLSTKIPQYMASGRPILYYGPKGIASCQYILDNQCGVVVDSKDSYKLLGALRELVARKDLREQLGNRAREIALTRHASEIVRQDFRLALASAHNP